MWALTEITRALFNILSNSWGARAPSAPSSFISAHRLDYVIFRSFIFSYHKVRPSERVVGEGYFVKRDLAYFLSCFLPLKREKPVFIFEEREHAIFF